MIKNERERERGEGREAKKVVAAPPSAVACSRRHLKSIHPAGLRQCFNCGCLNKSSPHIDSTFNPSLFLSLRKYQHKVSQQHQQQQHQQQQQQQINVELGDPPRSAADYNEATGKCSEFECKCAELTTSQQRANNKLTTSDSSTLIRAQ